jgi:hypothetical protein
MPTSPLPTNLTRLSQVNWVFGQVNWVLVIPTPFMETCVTDWSFVTISSKRCVFQTVRARELTFQRIFTSPQLSCVKCHMAPVHVTCDMWHVTCLADSGKSRGCSINSLVIHSFSQSVSQPFPPTAVRRRHTQRVRDSSSSYKID